MLRFSSIHVLVMAMLVVCSARADELPVIVAYTAPPDCASQQAFEELLKAQVGRTPNPRRPWRFSIVIEHEKASYQATLAIGTSTRVLSAPACDDLTAALATIIAMAEPEDGALPVPTEPPPPPPPPPIISRDRHLIIEEPPELPPAPRPQRSNKVDFRLGARFQDWVHFGGSSAFGPTLSFSAESPWGLFQHTMFEASVGGMYSDFLAQTPSGHTTITRQLLDTQVCPVDISLGSGFSALGCIRMAMAMFQSNFQAGNAFDFWIGGGGRIRWQSNSRIYLEAHINGVYGTVSSSEENSPAWFDFGGSIGFKLNE